MRGKTWTNKRKKSHLLQKHVILKKKYKKDNFFTTVLIVLYSKKCHFLVKTRDEDPTFFSTDPDLARLKKNSGSGSDRNEEKNIFIFKVGRDKLRYHNQSFYA